MEGHGRPSHDERRAVAQTSNPNVFDDEYAIESPDEEVGLGIPDGFRPVQAEEAHPQIPRDRTSVRRSQHGGATADSKAGIPRNRSSIQKGPLGYGAFGLGSDGSRGGGVGRGGGGEGEQENSAMVDGAQQSPQPPHRATSSASSYAPFERAQSMAQSFHGPSHPYGMYPQGTGPSRTLSVATSSTQNAPAAQANQTHPYGLYQQNVFDDHAAIPVGFPGRGEMYHRQIGPDGEEQDIIGPDGHAEQLPPYSRYPEEGTGKVVPVAVEAAPRESPSSPVNDSTGPLPPLPPLPLGSPHQSLHPSLPPSLHPSLHPSQRNSAASGSIPPSETMTMETGSTERSWNEKSWSEKRRHRFCGGKVPFWVAVAGASIILLAAVIGGIIGGFKSRAKDDRPEKPQAVATVSVTQSMFDATLLPLPTSLPPLPNGRWALPLGIPEEQQKGCLSNPNEVNAWSCQTAGPPLRFIFQTFPDGRPGAFIDGDVEENPTVQFGTQPPEIRIQSLSYVSDLDEPARGPALHFQTNYDKVVVLGQDQISPAGTPNKKRDAYSTNVKYAYPPPPPYPPPDGAPPLPDGSLPPPGPPPPPPQDGSPGTPPGGFRHKAQVQPGQPVWYCYWNSTFIEGFIYLSQNSSFASAISSRTSAPYSTPAPPPSSGSSTGAPITSTSSSQTPLASPPTSAPSSGPTVAARDQPFIYKRAEHVYARDMLLPRFEESIPVFPYIVKIEERRLNSIGPEPYCTKMQIFEDGHVGPVPDANGNPITVQLNEKDPAPSQIQSMLRPGPGPSSALQIGPEQARPSQSSTQAAAPAPAAQTTNALQPAPGASAIPTPVQAGSGKAPKKHPDSDNEEDREEAAEERAGGEEKRRWVINRRDDPPGSCHCQWVST